MSIISIAAADSWEDVTEEQAELIVAHLKLHSYILDYCDCCGENDVHLMQVIVLKSLNIRMTQRKNSIGTGRGNWENGNL